MNTKMLQVLCLTVVGGGLMIAGCKVSHENRGKDEKVSIEAPGASVKVDTTAAAASDSGLPVYPGAQEKHGNGDDKGRAHVNVNTPFVQVKVVAAKYTSDDAPEKVLAFYRGKLAGYGTVIECRGGGDDVQLGHGKGLNDPVKCSKGQTHGDQVNLKVGTEGNQHQVSVTPSGKGSEFELIYVRLGAGKDDDSFAGKQPS